MSTSSEYDFAGHDDRIRQHYDHARKKHHYFCDKMFDKTNKTFENVTDQLSWTRLEIKVDASNDRLEFRTILECEMLEALEALHNGDKAQGVEELYDAIAVCLRAIDVIEGRQKLGKQEEAK